MKLSVRARLTTAGTYATLCWFPDPKTGMPHAMMGMTRVIELD